MFNDKKIRVLIFSMSTLVFFAILLSVFYYKNLNNSVDPRVIEARKLYEKYNDYATNNQYDSVFCLMDSIEKIYCGIVHYKNSFETGVLYNNRAAAYLTIASRSDSSNIEIKDSLIGEAKKATLRSIEIYENWVKTFQNKNSTEIENFISKEFISGLQNYTPEQCEKFLKTRVKEMEDGIVETNRRLSVSYTNLGVICRNLGDYEAAARYYKKAIDLWDQNLTAENNLNILLGRPIKKRNFIQKLFPPERD